MKSTYIITIATFVLITSCKQQLESRLSTNSSESENIVLTGKYLGQTLPYATPKLFGRGIISNGLINRDITFSPTGNEMYFTFATTNYSYATILSTKLKNGVWVKPEVASFAKDPNYTTIEPCLSYDGNLLYFASNRPINDSTKLKDENIWVVRRDGNDWGEPWLLDTTINTGRGEFYPSLTKNGTMYFTRAESSGVHSIYRSAFINGAFDNPEKLPKQVNCGRNRFNAYVSPDEKFIIIPAVGVEKDVTGVNYYITFKDKDNWSKPINMGQTVNKDLGRGWSASLSPDGEYLFFMSSRGLSKESQPTSLSYKFFQTLQTSPKNGNADIYWVKANFIDSLKVMAEYPINIKE